MTHAQEPELREFSFDPIEVRPGNVPGATCYVSPRYIVVECHREQQVGSDFFIRPSQSGRCDADSLSGDFVLRDEWAAYFSAVQGNVLFIDSGTGPDIRYLILVDMAEQRRLAEMSYVDLIPGPDSLTVGVWDGSELEEPLPGCEMPPGGLIPGVDSLFYLDVRSGKRWFSGELRCAQRQ
jgi:hypothetical protein